MDIHTESLPKGMATDVKLFVPSLSRYVVIDNCTGDIVSPQAAVYFAQGNCRGEAFVDNTLFYSLGKVGQLYYTGQDQTPRFRKMFSILVVDAKGNEMCIGGGEPMKMVVVPAQVLKELPFSMPLALPLFFGQK